MGFHVYAQTRTSRSIQWRWERDPQGQSFETIRAFTLVPGYPAHQLKLATNAAKPAEVTDLYFVAEVKTESHGGFELRDLAVARR